MTDTSIPRGAVDAAARALGNHIELDFDVLPADEQLQAREVATAALNAAAPHLEAAALDRLIRDPKNFTPGGEFRATVLVNRIAELKSGVDEPVEPQPESLGRIARVWSVGDPEPDDCTEVRDRHGNVWVRRFLGWLMGDDDPTDPVMWGLLVLRSGPITEVLDTEAGVDEPAKSAEPQIVANNAVGLPRVWRASINTVVDVAIERGDNVREAVVELVEHWQRNTATEGFHWFDKQRPVTSTEAGV